MTTVDINRLPLRRVRPSVAIANRSASVRLACPSCSGAVYVPGDSAGERIACMTCGAQLVTRQVVDLIPFDGGAR